MRDNNTLVTFTLPEPHPVALRQVRKALERTGLRIPLELDVTAHIRREMGAALAPCVVLYVDDPALLLEAVVFDRGAALLMPQPVVVSGDNRQTEITMHHPGRSLDRRLAASVRDPLLTLYLRIVSTMETVAERKDTHFSVAS